MTDNVTEMVDELRGWADRESQELGDQSYSVVTLREAADLLESLSARGSEVEVDSVMPENGPHPLLEKPITTWPCLWCGEPIKALGRSRYVHLDQEHYGNHQALRGTGGGTTL